MLTFEIFIESCNSESESLFWHILHKIFVSFNMNVIKDQLVTTIFIKTYKNISKFENWFLLGSYVGQIKVQASLCNTYCLADYGAFCHESSCFHCEQWTYIMRLIFVLSFFSDAFMN
jgi:hypothetical protein